MASSKEHTFDIVSSLDYQELKNSIIQATKEINNRYDFKGIVSTLDLDISSKIITIISSSDNKCEAIKDILISKMNKRGLSINSLEDHKKESCSSNNMKYTYKVLDTISKSDIKTIQDSIKKSFLKLTSIIQGESIRVSGKKIDDLQAIMSKIKSLKLTSPISFDNFR